MSRPNKDRPDFKMANAVPTPQLVESLGLKMNHSRQIRCPAHQENTPSCKVYEDHAYCFGCNKRFSNIDLVMFALGLKSLVEAAERILNGNIKPRVVTPKTATENKEKDAQAAAVALKRIKRIYRDARPISEHPGALAHWLASGLAELSAFIFAIRVAYWDGCERILFPDFRRAEFDPKTGLLIGQPVDYLIGLTGRRFDEVKEKKYYNELGLPKNGFLLETYKHCKPAKIILVEGHKDGIAGYELGLHAVGLCGQDTKPLDELIDAEWYIYPDKDARGLELRKKIEKIAREKGKKLTEIDFGGGKDLCDGLKHLKLKPPYTYVMRALEDCPGCFDSNGTYMPGPVAFGKFAELMAAQYRSRKPNGT